MNMKKILLASIAVLSLACGKTPRAEEYGRVDFTVRTQDYVNEAVKSSVSDFASVPSASDFNILIRDAYGTQVYSGAISEWSAETLLSAGEYTVTATYGDSEDEGFSKPAFSGETVFTIQGGQTNPVSIDASLSNCIVKVQASDNFNNYYPDWNFTVTTGLGTSLPFPKGEDRGAFIYAYKFTVSGNLTSQSGAVKTFSKEYQPLSPATCYSLSFDVADVSGSSISISFDDAVETVVLEDIELNN